MKKRLQPDAAGSFSTPLKEGLEDLRKRLGPLPEGPTAPVAQAPRGPARAVVRFERKGRGGKTITRVEQLGLQATERELWLKELKQALGCGGTVEGETLVFQGDLRERLSAL